MTCCPPVPSIKLGGDADSDFHTQDTKIRQGETVECFMKRAGNDTGRQDDKTNSIPDKIENVDVPLGANADLDPGNAGIQFRLTANSTKVASRWALCDASDSPTTFVGTTFNNSTGKWVGTFDPQYHSKPQKIHVIAYDSTNAVIDNRGFVFSPAKATGHDEIVFIHPLPGAHCSSPFGPRTPPKVGASAMHGGADFSVAPASPGEVLAAADGTVTFVEPPQEGGAGNYIKIEHKNTRGAILCTTVYMHLNKIYVSKGQVVVAGQKIGLEGNTGIGTGPHLHFECRLPNGTKIDPVPLIRGQVNVARQTNPDNTAVQSSIEAKNNANVLTPANVDAKQNGCEPFGAGYPPDPTETHDSVPAAPITDPFEAAWFFTMTKEVGPNWTQASPSDSEVAQGLIDTSPQRKKDGYVNRANYPGGETKFGIAQGPNPSIKVTTLPYDSAKQTGYNNYWKRGPSALVSTKPKTAVMLFDINYLHGVGNGNKIRANSGIDNTASDVDSIAALSKAQQDYMHAIVDSNPNRQQYLNGWLNRSNALLAYVKTLT